MVDDLREGVEVERDQIVDMQSREVLHGVERRCRAVVAAELPGRVDPVLRVDRVPVAIDVHLEVAREREQRKCVVGRVGSEEHQGVGVGSGIGIRSVGRATYVVAGDESNRRLGCLRDLQSVLLHLHERLGAGRHRVQGLLPVEIDPSGSA